MMIIDGCGMFDQRKIANTFDKFFMDIGPKLTFPIPSSFRVFKNILTLFKMRGQGAAKRIPTSFSPVISTDVGIFP